MALYGLRGMRRRGRGGGNIVGGRGGPFPNLSAPGQFIVVLYMKKQNNILFYERWCLTLATLGLKFLKKIIFFAKMVNNDKFLFLLYRLYLANMGFTGCLVTNK